MPGCMLLQSAPILIAEDNALLALDMAAALRQAGANVIGPAATLEEALALVWTPALVCGVLDVSLRNEFVFPAAKVLRDRHAGIVFYTGHSDAETLKLDWPEARVLTKPAPDKLLIEAVCAVSWASETA